MPAIGMREIVAALHRRRERRQVSARELQHALEGLGAAVERHLQRIGELRRAVESHGGNMEALRYYDNVMAKLRAELRFAERSLAEVFRGAADGKQA
jgi:hypothetical protein